MKVGKLYKNPDETIELKFVSAKPWMFSNTLSILGKNIFFNLIQNIPVKMLIIFVNGVEPWLFLKAILHSLGAMITLIGSNKKNTRRRFKVRQATKLVCR